MKQELIDVSDENVLKDNIIKEELRLKIKKMPKVELHLHLDGSIPISYLKEKYHLSEEEINTKIVANEKCKNLNDYLTCFEFLVSIMQTEEDLKSITIELLKELKKQNIIYVELRFAPQYHTKKGLSQEEVVKSVIEAKNTIDIKSNLILCLMRGTNNKKENYETIKVAQKYLNKGVCAIDLAGAEALYKTSNFREFFTYANENNIPFTIHAGEADGVESIKNALSFGAKRIGHGVRSIEDDELIKYLCANKIPLEVCPTSNIQTCICSSYADHPLENLYKKGVLITINTDNMTVSNTTLTNEYMNIINNTTLTLEDIIEMNINSLKSSFLLFEEKEELLGKYLIHYQ